MIDRTKSCGSTAGVALDEIAAAGTVPSAAMAADTAPIRVRFLRLMDSSFRRIGLDASQGILKGR